MDIEVQFTANLNQEENGVDLAKYIINLGVCLVEQEVVDIETEKNKINQKETGIRSERNCGYTSN